MTNGDKIKVAGSYSFAGSYVCGQLSLVAPEPGELWSRGNGADGQIFSSQPFTERKREREMPTTILLLVNKCKKLSICHISFYGYFSISIYKIDLKNYTAWKIKVILKFSNLCLRNCEYKVEKII